MLFLIYKSPRYFLPSFKSTGILVQKKKFKTDFHDDSHDGHLGFQTGIILVIFDLQVTLILPTKFRVTWLVNSEVQNRFARWLQWQPPWISNWNNLTIFDLQVTMILPTKPRVSWLFGSGDEVQIRFSGWPLAAMVAILDFRSE